jgi:hypothetical protein
MAKKNSPQAKPEPKPKTAADYYEDVDFLIRAIGKEMERVSKKYVEGLTYFTAQIAGGYLPSQAIASYGRDLISRETDVLVNDALVNLFIESPLEARYSEGARANRAEQRAQFAAATRREKLVTLREAHKRAVEAQMNALSMDKSTCWLSSTVSQVKAQAAADLLTGYNWLNTLVNELEMAEKALNEAEALELMEKAVANAVVVDDFRKLMEPQAAVAQ